MKLLASYLLSESQVVEPAQPEGVYDPVEQLWVSDGVVVACGDLLGDCCPGNLCNAPELLCELGRCV